MNAKNARSAMNASKAALLIAIFMLGGPPAWADDSAVKSDIKVTKSDVSSNRPPAQGEGPLAPSLYGLREILVEYPIFSDPRAATECGLSRETLLTVMQRNLQDPGLEILVLNATHDRNGVRARLTYEISTVRQDQSCISFVNMSFTDQASIILPPVKIPRQLTITYWQKSQAARSPADRHQTTVGDTLASLSRSFLRDVKLAEPATYSLDQARPEISEEEEKNERQMQMLRSINESVEHRLINQGSGADIPDFRGAPPPSGGTQP